MNIKKIMIVFLLMLALVAQAQTFDLSSVKLPKIPEDRSDLQALLQEAQKTNKLVLIVFKRDTCKGCKNLKEIMGRPGPIENLTLEEAVKQKYVFKDLKQGPFYIYCGLNGVPSYIVFSPEGEIISANSGSKYFWENIKDVGEYPVKSRLKKYEREKTLEDAIFLKDFFEKIGNIPASYYFFNEVTILGNLSQLPGSVRDMEKLYMQDRMGKKSFLFLSLAKLRLILGLFRVALNGDDDTKSYKERLGFVSSQLFCGARDRAENETAIDFLWICLAYYQLRQYQDPCDFYESQVTFHRGELAFFRGNIDLALSCHVKYFLKDGSIPEDVNEVVWRFLFNRLHKNVKVDFSEHGLVLLRINSMIQKAIQKAKRQGIENSHLAQMLDTKAKIFLFFGEKKLTSKFLLEAKRLDPNEPYYDKVLTEL